MENKLRMILEELLNGQEEMTQDNFSDVKDKIINQALLALQQEWIRMLPPMKNPNILPQQRLSTPDEIIYNQAISDMHSKIMGIKP